MKKEITLSEALGKTLEDFEFSNVIGQAVLVFDDDTFTTLDTDMGYDHGDQKIKEGKLELHQFGDTELIDLGIVTQAELDDMRQIKSKNALTEKEKRELAEYKRLRAKYESHF